jgi:hypothetical protein
MHTYDYNDVKVEIALLYDIQGFYYQLNPDGITPRINTEVSGFGPITKIEILDQAAHSFAMAAAVLVSVLMIM